MAFLRWFSKIIKRLADNENAWKKVVGRCPLCWWLGESESTEWEDADGGCRAPSYSNANPPYVFFYVNPVGGGR
jgi:hypothetical protein